MIQKQTHITFSFTPDHLENIEPIDIKDDIEMEIDNQMILDSTTNQPKSDDLEKGKYLVANLLYKYCVIKGDIFLRIFGLINGG